MNLRGTLVFAAFFLLVSFGIPAARAQASIYGTVTVDHVSDIKCLQTVCGSGDGTINPIGGTGGIFYDFKTYGPVRLGVDVRGSSLMGNKNAATYFNTARPRVFSALGGIRVSARTPIFRLRPYAEGAVGFANTNLPVPENPYNLQNPVYPNDGRVYYHSGVAFRGFIGSDLPLLPFMDFRIVELGIGALRNGGSTYPVESISSGLVFHLPY